MNIFALDRHPIACAQYHVDKHVVKMIVESAQLLSTVVRLNGIDAGYKITHQNHPCAKWARESLGNWLWLRELVVALNDEWKFRFNHDVNHKSYDVVFNLPKPILPNIGCTSFAQAMPDDCKDDDVVKAYRQYYVRYKQHLAKWTKRQKPEWYK